MKAVVLLGFLLVAGAMQAQLSLTEFNKERYQVNRTGFAVLGSWGAVNMVSGAIGWSTAGGEAKYFHQMNLIWGTVNLLVALPGYLGARHGTSDNTLAGTVKGQGAIEKTFALNAGLDIAYIAGSAWFLEKANNSANPDKYRGYGKSILMQGAVLLLFDAVMFSTHNHHGKKLNKLLSGLQVGPKSAGLNVSI